MAQNWDYAELSKAAKAAGGPEKYVEMLEYASRNAGRRDMFPLVGAVAVGAPLLTVAAIKVVEYFKSKKQQDQKNLDVAKQEIIAGIKAYDSEHESNNNSDIE